MPTKWLQERADGSKNGHGIGFEGPGVGVVLIGAVIRTGGICYPSIYTAASAHRPNTLRHQNVFSN